MARFYRWFIYKRSFPWLGVSLPEGNGNHEDIDWDVGLQRISFSMILRVSDNGDISSLVTVMVIYLVYKWEDCMEYSYTNVGEIAFHKMVFMI